MAKRIGIISDTHGMVRPEVLDILKTCDCIFHAGDICRPEVLDLICPLASLYAVQGNNDRLWQKPLAKSLSFTLEGIRFFLVHDKKDVGWNLKNSDVIIFGHTHKYYEQEIGGKLWLNPGSCGPGRFGNQVTMAVMTVDQGNYQIEKIVLE